MEIVEMDKVNNETRTIIVTYLEISKKLEMAAKEVLENNVSLTTVATNYDLTFSILHQKVNIIERKRQFYEEQWKYDAGVKSIIQERFSYVDVALNLNINPAILFCEARKAYDRGPENYTYDRMINPQFKTFTYLQEELLLNDLIMWECNTWADCTCQLCAMEELSTLAYEFAKRKEIPCPLYWIEYNRADNVWLIEFEMRHSKEISHFKPFVTCWKETILDCSDSSTLIQSGILNYMTL